METVCVDLRVCHVFQIDATGTAVHMMHMEETPPLLCASRRDQGTLRILDSTGSFLQYL